MRRVRTRDFTVYNTIGTEKGNHEKKIISPIKFYSFSLILFKIFHFIQVLWAWAYYQQRIGYQSLWEILSTFQYWANTENQKWMFENCVFLHKILFVKKLKYQLKRGMEFVGINIASTLLCLLSRWSPRSADISKKSSSVFRNKYILLLYIKCVKVYRAK